MTWFNPCPELECAAAGAEVPQYVLPVMRGLLGSNA